MILICSSMELEIGLISFDVHPTQRISVEPQICPKIITQSMNQNPPTKHLWVQQILAIQAHAHTHIVIRTIWFIVMKQTLNERKKIDHAFMSNDSPQEWPSPPRRRPLFRHRPPMLALGFERPGGTDSSGHSLLCGKGKGGHPTPQLCEGEYVRRTGGVWASPLDLVARFVYLCQIHCWWGRTQLASPHALRLAVFNL